MDWIIIIGVIIFLIIILTLFIYLKSEISRLESENKDIKRYVVNMDNEYIKYLSKMNNVVLTSSAV